MTKSSQRAYTINQLEALDRLVAIAKSDTGQSRRVADFLLAWWNPSTCGGFDLTNLWNVDAEIIADMMIVFDLIARAWVYPDALGYKADFEKIIEQWRPELLEVAR